MKIVAISDTHGAVVKGLPNADLLIHAGDWSGSGTYKETKNFINWMQTIRHKFKRIICVPGNHDRFVELNLAQAKQEFKDSDIQLLVDEETEFEGAKIYGTPWSPVFGDWAFMADDYKRKLAADAIPFDVSILITHAPPWGFLDKLAENGSDPGMSAGCIHLAQAILRVQPEAVICGHIHEGSGITTLGKTLIVNAAHMNEYYVPTNAFKVIYI